MEQNNDYTAFMRWFLPFKMKPSISKVRFLPFDCDEYFSFTGYEPDNGRCVCCGERVNSVHQLYYTLVDTDYELVVCVCDECFRGVLHSMNDVELLKRIVLDEDIFDTKEQGTSIRDAVMETLEVLIKKQEREQCQEKTSLETLSGTSV